MDAEDERRKSLHEIPVEEEIRCQPSPFVMKRREMTDGFDERQKQLFDQALIAILTADMPPDKLAAVLGAAYDTTIQVFSWQMLAETRLPNPICSSPLADRLSPAGRARPMLLSCITCHGYSLTLRGDVVQCDDCGAIQPTLENISGRGDSRERNRTKDERPAELFDHGHISKKQIVNVALNGTTLALMFHDGIQRQTTSDPAVHAISYLLRVLDTMFWAREALENRLLRFSKRKLGDP